MHPATVAVASGRPQGIGAPLNHPVVLASSFRGEAGDYSRWIGTPTWDGLEQAVGALEGGTAVSFSSGMGACSGVLFALAPKVLVLPSNSYMGMRDLVSELEQQQSLEVRWVDTADTAAVVAAVPGADVVWLETATNPMLEVADIPTIAAAAAAHGAKVVVDNTFATPVCCRPLELGATVSLHSGTKFIGGHSDLLIGIAVTSDPEVHERLRRARLLAGTTPGALEAFLALRGVRTLPLRVERAQANAQELVVRLTAHPAVEQVRYPGFGAMVSFVLAGGAEAADRACRTVQLVVAATSLGGVETSMERRQKYAGDAHVPPGLLRMSVGIEHVDDIWHDLEQALAAD
jgi:cystathionine gamma-synthase